MDREQISRCEMAWSDEQRRAHPPDDVLAAMKGFERADALHRAHSASLAHYHAAARSLKRAMEAHNRSAFGRRVGYRCGDNFYFLYRRRGDGSFGMLPLNIEDLEHAKKAPSRFVTLQPATAAMN